MHPHSCAPVPAASMAIAKGHNDLWVCQGWSLPLLPQARFDRVYGVLQAWEVTAGGKALLLDVEFEWLGVLEN